MSKEKENDFLFSVVIPVYKVEDYIEETIQSVLQQTIGFEKHIQMILVNDGSPDNSGAVAAIWPRWTQTVRYKRPTLIGWHTSTPTTTTKTPGVFMTQCAATKPKNKAKKRPERAYAFSGLFCINNRWILRIGRFGGCCRYHGT